MSSNETDGILSDAAPVKSTGSPRRAKLGRRRTAIAGSRALLRIMGQENAPLVVSSQLLWKTEEELKILDGSRSIGDAMGGE